MRPLVKTSYKVPPPPVWEMLLTAILLYVAGLLLVYCRT